MRWGTQSLFPSKPLDWLKILIIPIVTCLLLLFLINLRDSYQATAIIYPTLSSTGEIKRGSLKGMSRIDRRLTVLLYRAAKRDFAINNATRLGLLKSHQLMRLFIENQDILPLLYPKRKTPSIFKATVLLKKQLIIKQDQKSQFVKITYKNKEPAVAAMIINQYIQFVNSHINQYNKSQLQSKLSRIDKELNKTNVKALRQALITERETLLMQLNDPSTFSIPAFEVIDWAEVPEKPIFKRPIIVLALTFFISFGYVLIRSAAKREKNIKRKLLLSDDLSLL